MPGSLESSAPVIVLVIWGIPRAGTTLVVRRSSVERQEASMDCYSNVAYIIARLSDKTRQNRLKNGQVLQVPLPYSCVFGRVPLNGANGVPPN